MADVSKTLSTAAAKRHAARYAAANLEHLLVDAMMRDGYLDPVRFPGRENAVRELLKSAARIVGTMQRAPCVVYVVHGREVATVSYESKAELDAFTTALAEHADWEQVSVHYTLDDALERIGKRKEDE